MKLNAKSLKLKGIPKILYLNNDSDNERKEYMESQFLEWDISNYERISTTKYSPTNYIKWKKHLDNTELFVSENLISKSFNHIKAIIDWYDNSDDPYCIIMEDIIDLSVVDYWMFDWKTLIDNLPYNWDCVSLVSILATIEIKSNKFKKEFNVDLEVHQKYSTTCSIPMHLRQNQDSKIGPYCYMITRHFAKKLKKLHYNGKKIKLFVNTNDKKINEYENGLLRNIIFDLGLTYIIPVFNVNKKYLDDYDKTYFDILVEQMSSDAIEYWWAEKSKLFSTYEFFSYNKRFDWKMETTFDVTKRQVFKERVPKNTILWI